MTQHSSPVNAECPFCGGSVDPAGWMSSDKATGPACDDCGASAPTLESWNGWKARAAPAQPLPTDLARITELRVFEHGGFRAIVDGVGGWGSTQLAAIENATANAKKLNASTVPSTEQPPVENKEGGAVWPTGTGNTRQDVQLTSLVTRPDGGTP